MKKLTALVLCLALLSACGGRGPAAGEGYTERPGKVVICIDYSFVSSARALLNVLQAEKRAPDIEFEVLPKDGAAREAKLTAIRTALMAGSGPDAFIFFNNVTLSYDAGMEPVFGEPLFPDPAKTMRSGVLLPLDELMAESSYMDTEKMDPVVLAAGRTEEGQMILPLMYTLPYTVVRRSALNDPDFSCHSWAELAACDEPLIRCGFADSFVYGVLARMADYDTETLTFTREDLARTFEEMYGMRGEQPHATEEDGYVYTGCVRYNTDVALKEGGLLFCPVYNDAGGVTALVTVAAAINANSRHAAEAFTYLETFFHSKIAEGKGKSGPIPEGQEFFNAIGAGWQDGVFIQSVPRSAIRSAIHNMPVPVLRAIEEMTGQVTHARFFSSMDKEFDSGYIQYFLAKRKGDPAAMAEAADSCYDRLEMILAE